MKNVEYSQDLHLRKGGTISMNWERGPLCRMPEALGDVSVVHGNTDGDVPSRVIIALLPEGFGHVTQSVVLTHEEAIAAAKFILENIERRL